MTYSIEEIYKLLPERLRKPRLRRGEACEFLEIVYGIVRKPQTLAKYASVGGGPGFQKVNRTPLYPINELVRWAESLLSEVRVSTSDVDAA